MTPRAIVKRIPGALGLKQGVVDFAKWGIESLNRTTVVEMLHRADRECPICGYQGKFEPFGLYYIRPDAVCGQCESLERHRQLHLYLVRENTLPKQPRVLHFAPEDPLRGILGELASDYVTADLFGGNVDFNWNIEAVDAPDQSFDLIVCCHVLEHVDAPKALREIRRLLRPGGAAIFMIPICEGLEATYENPSAAAADDMERWKYFQQTDHVRLFGPDFRDIVRAEKFEIEESVADLSDVVRYGLVAGERIFVTRPR